jgi:thiol:disulfide interchange protein DsbD
VIDAIGDGIRLMQVRSPAALPVLFGAGLITSIGPCVAPRYIALAALAHRAPRPWLTATVFATGIVAAYVMIGVCAGSLAQLQQWSTAIDLAFAAALAAGGLMTLLRDDTHTHTRTHVHTQAHVANSRVAEPRSWTVACMGAASALVVSPCCTPVVAAIAGLAAFGARPVEGALLLAAFAAGHVLPLGVVVCAPAGLATTLRSRVSTHAGAVISGTLLLALAAFYGVLA